MLRNAPGGTEGDKVHCAVAGALARSFRVLPIKHSSSHCVALFMLGYIRVNKDANSKPSKQGGCQAELEVGGEGSCSSETGVETVFTFSFPAYPLL